MPMTNITVNAILGSANRQSYREKILVDKIIWNIPADGVSPTDIALYRLERDIPLSDSVQIIRLPDMSMEDFSYENTLFSAVGWGCEIVNLNFFFSMVFTDFYKFQLYHLMELLEIFQIICSSQV